MDETYIKVKGKRTYLYRAVDKYLKTLDFMLSQRRDKAAVRRFFERAIKANGVPQRVVIDKVGVNLAGLLRINVGLKFSRAHHRIKILRVKYLNNIVEQDHRFIKKITRPTSGFKALHSAAATLAGAEVAHMIRKKQFQTNHISPFKLLGCISLRKSALFKPEKTLRQIQLDPFFFFTGVVAIEFTLGRCRAICSSSKTSSTL